MSVTCGNRSAHVGGVVAAHDSVASVRACFAGVVQHTGDADEAWYMCNCADCDARREDECRAEVWAEGAWLRAAEAGTPDSWAEEERERGMARWLS